MAPSSQRHLSRSHQRPGLPSSTKGFYAPTPTAALPDGAPGVRQWDEPYSVALRAEAVSPAVSSDPPERQGAVPNDPQAMTSALAAFQALFLLPLRSWLSWQGAWLRLLSR